MSTAKSLVVFGLSNFCCTAASVYLVLHFMAPNWKASPPTPLPAQCTYSVDQLTDDKFADSATSLVNLISTFQPATARRQFVRAKDFLAVSAQADFDTAMLNTEIRSIEEAKRSQMFFINHRLVKVERFPELGQVIVRIPGVRQKLIGSKPLVPDELVYYVTLTTAAEARNRFGITVTDIQSRSLNEQKISEADSSETPVRSHRFSIADREIDVK